MQHDIRSGISVRQITDSPRSDCTVPSLIRRGISLFLHGQIDFFRRLCFRRHNRAVRDIRHIIQITVQFCIMARLFLNKIYRRHIIVVTADKCIISCKRYRFTLTWYRIVNSARWYKWRQVCSVSVVTVPSDTIIKIQVIVCFSAWSKLCIPFSSFWNVRICKDFLSLCKDILICPRHIEYELRPRLRYPRFNCRHAFFQHVLCKSRRFVLKHNIVKISRQDFLLCLRVIFMNGQGLSQINQLFDLYIFSLFCKNLFHLIRYIIVIC